MIDDIMHRFELMAALEDEHAWELYPPCLTWMAPTIYDPCEGPRCRSAPRNSAAEVSPDSN